MKIAFDNDAEAAEFWENVCWPLQAVLGRLEGSTYEPLVSKLSKLLAQAYLNHHMAEIEEGRAPEASQKAVSLTGAALPTLNVRQLKRMAVQQALSRGGSREEQAHLLGIPLRTLHRVINEYVDAGGSVTQPALNRATAAKTSSKAEAAPA